MGTTVEGSNFEAAITKGFTVRAWSFCIQDDMASYLYKCACDMRVLLNPQRLFRYISGNNVDNAKISMTAPVITFVKPTADFKSADKNYTVAFYLPQQFQVWFLTSPNTSRTDCRLSLHVITEPCDWD